MTITSIITPVSFGGGTTSFCASLVVLVLLLVVIVGDVLSNIATTGSFGIVNLTVHEAAFTV